MASKYLDLYGNYEVKTWDRNSNVYRSPVSEAARVVHDTVNNKYYGMDSQSAIVSGLTNAIKNSEKLVNSATGQRFERGARGGGKYVSYTYSAAEKRQHNQQLANQQKYLEQINNGMYKQEANTFFDSYDAYTQDWNNLFTKRYNNEQVRLKNEKIVTRDKNEKIRARNKRVGKANLRTDKIKKMNNELEKDQSNQQGTGSSLSYNVGPSTKLEINTGLNSEKTQNRKKSNAVLADNGLNI
jgi:hypothetical protein